MQHRFLICLIVLVLGCAQATAQDAPRPAGNDYASLIALFREFREFAPPRVRRQRSGLHAGSDDRTGCTPQGIPAATRGDRRLAVAGQRARRLHAGACRNARPRIPASRQPPMAARPGLLQHDASRLRTEDPRRNGDSQAAAVRGGCSQLSRQARGRAEDTRAGAQQSHRCARGPCAARDRAEEDRAQRLRSAGSRSGAQQSVTAPGSCARAGRHGQIPRLAGADRSEAAAARRHRPRGIRLVPASTCCCFPTPGKRCA